MTDELEPRIDWLEDAMTGTLGSFEDTGNVVPIRPTPESCIDTIRAKRQAVLDCQKLVEVDERLLAESRAALTAARNELAVATHQLWFSLGVE